jgi:hypothetical protein
MFLKNSRYAKTETVISSDVKHRSLQAIKLRRLPVIEGIETVVDNSHKLDVISKRQYKDGTKFWHIADANSELQANALLDTIGALINVPQSGTD